MKANFTLDAHERSGHRTQRTETSTQNCAEEQPSRAQRIAADKSIPGIHILTILPISIPRICNAKRKWEPIFIASQERYGIAYDTLFPLFHFPFFHFPFLKAASGHMVASRPARHVYRAYRDAHHHRASRTGNLDCRGAQTCAWGQRYD